jgi:hypothetical protein
MIVNSIETLGCLQADLQALAADHRLYPVNGMHAFCPSGERLAIERVNPGAQFYLGDEIKRSTSRFSRAFEKEGVIATTNMNNGLFAIIAGTYHDNTMYVAAMPDYREDADDKLVATLAGYALKSGALWVPFSNGETPDLEGEAPDHFIRATQYGHDYAEMEARAARTADIVGYFRTKLAEGAATRAPQPDEMAHSA